MRNLSALLACVVLVAPGGEVLAQGFSSGSTGADGALAFDPAAGTVVFDPQTFVPPLDPDGDNVYHFTTITVPAGVTVRLASGVLPEARPVVWLASGAVTIDGVLDLNGQDGHSNASTPLPAVPGAGGYSGAPGGTGAKAPQAGNGPGGGRTAPGKHGGGAGHAVSGGETASTGAAGGTYGNEFLLPLVGGSGGAGGAFSGFSNGSGGGAGGGAILIASSTSIAVNGAITARGGNSGVCTQSIGDFCGGAGSGGAIRLVAPSIAGSGSLTATGGPGRSANGGGTGRIRLEAFTLSLTAMNPAPSVASPGLVFLPATAPAVRVVRVGGVDVTASPTGSFVTADVAIDAAAPVAIEIEARNVPPGTIVQLTLDPETGSPVTVNTTPLQGTAALSTASATATFPHGFTRLFVKASWTP